ncbi:ATP-binding protein [Piscinibacter terrae]|uniref:ATP-binding protein n=1 Tax=Piscinibacter terrae TaxID=2496871 RepID=A0A3N7HLQ7_9BURK|nr:ATP-binding protein [Albitalea terrae]RQP23068.1 ATP-binding protein [Albitalea terrae]
MFVYLAKTSRNVEVSFDIPYPSRRNQISLLTGPNGSGKTDVLASIARVFHGRSATADGASVRWRKDSGFRVSYSPASQDEDDRIRLVAQTFSPFSRFPPPPRLAPEFGSIYGRGDESKEQYVCIGFHQGSSIGLRKLARSTVENGILRLSEKPGTAKVAFDVLEELGFKSGIELTYRAHRGLSAIMSLDAEAERLENVLGLFASGREFSIDNQIFGKNVLKRFRREARNGDIGETAEYLRHAINLVDSYLVGREPHRDRNLEIFRFTAFRGREGMSSDFAYLQAFSVLARLELLELVGCKLTPIGGDPVDLTHASSGQQQMLCSIFGLAAALEDHSLVLIDEPELSLHPRWQMGYLKHLETALEVVQDCHVIIATHSPLIAQAAARHDVKTIAMDNPRLGRVSTSVNKRERTSVEEVLIDVFDTPIPNNLHISNEIFGLVTQAESGSFNDRLEARAQLEKYMLLYQRDGEGSREMKNLLDKALKLVENSSPTPG